MKSKKKEPSDEEATEDIEPPKPPKEEKKEESIIVVNELPQQAVRVAVDDKGKEHTLLTRDEALTEILITTRKLQKTLG